MKKLLAAGESRIFSLGHVFATVNAGPCMQPNSPCSNGIGQAIPMSS